jgi:hypothetical protein
MASWAVCWSFQKSGAADCASSAVASASSAGMSKTHHHMRDALSKRAQPVAKLLHVGVVLSYGFVVCILTDASWTDGVTM